MLTHCTVFKFLASLLGCKLASYFTETLLLLLLLSRFSRVQLCATPKTAAHQAPPSLGFSRQEHWSGLPFPSPLHENEKWKWSRSVVSDSPWPHRKQHTRLPRPWDSPGKNTGVGCHFLLQCMKVKSESEVAQLCPTLSNLMDCSLPGSSIHGIFQARVLEWVSIAFSNAWKWKVKVKFLSHARLLVTPWIAAYQSSLSMAFSRQEY